MKRVLECLGVTACSISLLILSFMLIFQDVNPYGDYLLIRYGKITRAVVVDAWENFVELETTHEAGWTHYCVYRLNLPNGQSVTRRSRTLSGRIPSDWSNAKQQAARIEVEYLATNPHISRVKGTGYTTLKELYWRSAFGVVLVLVPH